MTSSPQNSTMMWCCAHYIVEDTGSQRLGDRISQLAGDNLDLDLALSDSKFHVVLFILPNSMLLAILYPILQNDFDYEPEVSTIQSIVQAIQAIQAIQAWSIVSHCFSLEPTRSHSLSEYPKKWNSLKETCLALFKS